MLKIIQGNVYLKLRLSTQRMPGKGSLRRWPYIKKSPKRNI